MISTRRILTTVIIAGLISVPAYAAKNYYKWTDANGVTHYSARKPTDANAEVISVSTGLPRDDNGQPVQVEDEGQGTAAEGQTQTAQAAAVDNKDPERCEAAKNNLKIINENARIRERAEDGSTRYLTPEEIEERKQRAEKIIEESC